MLAKAASPPAKAAKPVAPAKSTVQSGRHCKLCDLYRRTCVHGLMDHQGKDIVFATRLGSNYHLNEDCNVMAVPRAASLGAGGGRFSLSSMSRQRARAQGLSPCRVCAGASAASRA